MEGMSRNISPDTGLLRRWVATWRRAGAQLEGIRRAEIESIDTQDAVRHIFGSLDRAVSELGPPTSGLIDQQAWFARLRVARRTP
jgi:hypothetical protein